MYKDFSWQYSQPPLEWHTSKCQTIQERANILQTKLFGKSSLLSIKLLQLSY